MARKFEYVDQPLVMRRYNPNFAPIAALYTRTGETLADISMAKGANTARGLAALGGLYSNYLADKGAAAAAAQAREDDLTEKELQRQEREAERAARKAEREADQQTDRRQEERAAARYLVDNTESGPVPAALAQFARQFPETAARFTARESLPARLTPGAVGTVDPEAQAFDVLEPSKEDLARSKAAADAAAARDAALKATIEDRAADSAHAGRVLAEQSRHNRAVEAAAGAKAGVEQKFVIRDGKVVPIAPGTAMPGDVPYSADAMQGMGGETADARTMRAAAALNGIDKLKTLAPKRVEGPVGMLQGAVETAKGYAGYNSDVRQYNALLQPTAMLMAVAIQGAAGLSNSERQAMALMLGNISTMDYKSQMALLENASEIVRGGADVQQVTVKDPKTGQPMTRWAPLRSRMPGTVTIGGSAPATTVPFKPGDNPAGLDFGKKP